MPQLYGAVDRQGSFHEQESIRLTLDSLKGIVGGWFPLIGSYPWGPTNYWLSVMSGAKYKQISITDWLIELGLSTDW